MSGISGKEGKELLLAILRELRQIDPRIIPFDSDEIQNLEYAVVQGVRDVFGSESPEYSEFEGFRISAGNISRGDSRAEKQSKYELGLPRAVKRIEAIIELVDQSDENIRDLSPEDLSEVEPLKEPPPARPSPPKPDPGASPGPSRPEAPAAPSPETGGGSAAGKPSGPSQPQSKPAALTHQQPGRVLILQEAEDSISTALVPLLDRIGIGIASLEEESPSEMEEILGLKNIAFTIMTVSTENRGGLSGLTSVIGKTHPKQESVFKLGLLVGILGLGRVVILHSGDKPQDIPQDLFGVRYIPYKEEGGWQIGLLKLLKANGFIIDANLLFD